ncbi:MAG: hypothetical protein AAGH68_02925 [Pseudomonadota bacterium]
MRTRHWACLAVLIPGLAHADPCALVDDGTIWDHEGSVVSVVAMTVLLVTRHESRQPLSGTPVESTLWTDDMPSDTIGAGNICDRVQLETPLPLNSWDRLEITMQQGERVPIGFDVAAHSGELAERIDADGRRVDLGPGRYFVWHVADLEQPDWREDLLAKAGSAGKIDTSRWVVGLPGALYLVPVRP